MFGWSLPTILVIAAIIFLVFGASKLPEIGSGFGKAIKNFKNSLSGKDEIDVTPEEEPLPEKKRIARAKTKPTTGKNTRNTGSRNSRKA